MNDKLFASCSVGLGDEEIMVRMTGCPNGCARPYMAELAFVGDGPDSYQVSRIEASASIPRAKDRVGLGKRGHYEAYPQSRHRKSSFPRTSRC